MLIREKTGNIRSFDLRDRTIDRVNLEWYESDKRILHRRTISGQELTLRFLKGRPELTQGDILYADDHRLIVVEILPCAALVIEPASALELAAICYEIGNRHLPLFYATASETGHAGKEGTNYAGKGGTTLPRPATPGGAVAKPGEILVPFEGPLARWLDLMGYAFREEQRQLLAPLRTSVPMHASLAPFAAEGLTPPGL